MYNETIELSNGVIVPQLALGTWFINDEDAAGAVRAAAAIGYRHFDTAQGYMNERGVGEGVRTCGIPRDQIFVTSKIASDIKDYKTAAESIDASLEKTGLEYIDLMLIHSPLPWDEFKNTERRFDGNLEVWQALTGAYKAGKVRAIGVSNFMKADLDSIIKNSEIKPMANQILCHIANTPLKLIQYCKDNGIAVEAYAPFGHGEALKIESLKVMADKYGVTLPQLFVRYDLQLGLITIPKTANPEHMKTNADVDFVISDEDMETLKNMPPIESYGRSGFLVVFDVWDEE